MRKTITIIIAILCFAYTLTGQGSLSSDDEQIFTKIMDGALPAVKQWLDAGNDVNRANDKGETLLHIAVKYDYVEIVKAILAYKPDLNRMTTAYAVNFPPLMRVKSVEVASLLLEAGVDVNAKSSGNTNVLTYVGTSDNFELIEYLLKKGCDVNHQDNTGWTVLMQVSLYSRDNSESVAFFLNNGADATLRTNDGSSALLFAANIGDFKSVKLLHNAGADVNVEESDFGWTPFLWACSGGHLEMAKYLWKNGADIYAENSKHGNAWQLAERKGHEDILKFLKKIRYKRQKTARKDR